MAGLKDKTPVSHLQEYLISQQIIPHYELIYNGVGTHNPVFTYRVEARGLKEEGTGRSKREAKHRAAERMLKSLQVTDCVPYEEDESNKDSIEPAENYVGQLKELCLIKRYPEPKYFLEEAAGPPHSRIFRMNCCVSQLQDHGVSTTKKHAKHQAAWKMLQRLKEYMVDEPFRPQNGDSNEFKKSVNDAEIIEKYNTFRPSTALSSANKDPVVFYKDYHKAYLGLHKTSQTLSSIASTQNNSVGSGSEDQNDSVGSGSGDQNDLVGSGSGDQNNLVGSGDSMTLIDDIARELEVTVSQLSVPSKEPELQFTIITMNLLPPIASIGENQKKAALNLIETLLLLSRE